MNKIFDSAIGAVRDMTSQEQAQYDTDNLNSPVGEAPTLDGIAETVNELLVATMMLSLE